MKTENDVVCKIGKLIQDNIATAAGNDRFTTSVGGGSSLIVGARDADGRERNFRITVTEEQNQQQGCCGAPSQCPTPAPVAAAGETGGPNG